MSTSELASPPGITMETTATIQITASPKSPPKAQKSLASSGLLRSDSLSRVKRVSSIPKQGTLTRAKNMPIEAWYYNPNSEEDPEEKDPTQPHRFNPDQAVPQEHLRTLGVLVWTSLQTRNYRNNQLYRQVKSERGYKHEEVVTVAPNRLTDYEQKKREFFKEHLHAHEEIRLILEGSGYEDIRDYGGHWIRIRITKGVLIVLPKGMYHRFTVDSTNYLKAVLLYQENPSRIQFDRCNSATDIMEVREQYVSNVLNRGTSLKVTCSDLSGMLEGLDEELEIFRARQEVVEATLDESSLYAYAIKVAQTKMDVLSKT